MGNGVGIRQMCLIAAALALTPTAAWAIAEGGSFYPGDLGQALATILVFIILLLVLRRWAWRPVCTQLQRREKAIAEALETAEQRRQEAEDLARSYKTRLDRAETEAADLLAKARKEAAEARREILQVAREEARKDAERAHREIDRASHEAMQDLRAATAQLATEIAARVIRKALTPEEHRRLVADSLAEIHRQAKRE